MSDRIKDAITRTWAQSPKTVFQILDGDANPGQLAETIRVLSNAIFDPDSDTTTQERAVARIFQIIDNRNNKGAIINAMETVGNLVKTNINYRERTISRLRQLVNDPRYSLDERRKAWMVLRNLGISDTSWPRGNLLLRPEIMFPVIILMILLALTFLARL